MRAKHRQDAVCEIIAKKVLGAQSASSGSGRGQQVQRISTRSMRYSECSTTFTLKRWNTAVVADSIRTSSPLLPQLRAESQVLRLQKKIEDLRVLARPVRPPGSAAPTDAPRILKQNQPSPNVAELPGRRSASFDTGGSQRDGEEAGESEASECSIPEELRQVALNYTDISGAQPPHTSARAHRNAHGRISGPLPSPDRAPARCCAIERRNRR